MPGIFVLIFIILFIAKIVGLITISWWWVTFPIWGVFIFWMIAAFLFGSFVVNVGSKRFSNKKGRRK